MKFEFSLEEMKIIERIARKEIRNALYVLLGKLNEQMEKDEREVMGIK